MSKMTTFFQLFLCLIPMFHLTTAAASHDEMCGPSIHCNVGTGLVCENGRCKCSSGPLTKNIAYNLVWNTEAGICVAQHKSACVGTSQKSVPEGWKSVPCSENLTCIQLHEMPLGVGSCETSLVGMPCNENSFCDAARSLICIEGACGCATSRPRTTPEYALVWNDQLANCIAPIGTTCIGTIGSPLAPGHKSISCEPEVDCISVDGHPSSVGICQARSSENNGAGELIHPTRFQLLLITVAIMMGFAGIVY